MWRDGQSGPQEFRVSYIKDTGEIYAARSRTAGLVANVRRLGVAPVDLDAPDGVYYPTLEKILEGWADGSKRPRLAAGLGHEPTRGAGEAMSKPDRQVAIPECGHSAWKSGSETVRQAASQPSEP